MRRWIGLALAIVACSRAQPERPSVSESPAVSELVRPAVARVIAVGDLHGDVEAARRALLLAGAIDATDHWAGGALTLVQTGDVLDRGDEDRKLFDWLEQLRPEAKAAGGELILLSGNHELMNVAQDFRYVTPRAFASFNAVGGRPAAFQPGGLYALRIALRPFVVQVGDSVFVHGGVLPEHVEYGLPRMQAELRAWLVGKGPLPTLVSDQDSPVWTRAFSTEAVDCARLARALALLGAKRMVVGHTPQRGISSACDERVWRIDTGMAHFYGGPVEVLELAGDRLRVLR